MVLDVMAIRGPYIEVNHEKFIWGRGQLAIFVDVAGKKLDKADDVKEDQLLHTYPKLQEI